MYKNNSDSSLITIYEDLKQILSTEDCHRLAVYMLKDLSSQHPFYADSVLKAGKVCTTPTDALKYTFSQSFENLAFLGDFLDAHRLPYDKLRFSRMACVHTFLEEDSILNDALSHLSPIQREALHTAICDYTLKNPV